jgi:hypothetical protein
MLRMKVKGKKSKRKEAKSNYSVFQGFSKAKSANAGSILSSSQFLILPPAASQNKACFKSGQS